VGSTAWPQAATMGPNNAAGARIISDLESKGLPNDRDGEGLLWCHRQNARQTAASSSGGAR